MRLFPSSRCKISRVVFELTPRCNLSCVFCYNHWKRLGSETPKELDFDRAKKVLSCLFSNTGLLHVTFSGGEPLLFSRLPELVLYCRMKGASVSIISNGNTGSHELYATLIKLGVELFELPFHSCNHQEHNAMARSKQAWLNAKNSIETILELGGNVVPVIVITRYNVENIGNTLTYLNSIGLNTVMLNRYNIGGVNASTPNEVMPSIAQLRKAFEQANNVSGRLGMRVSSNVCTPYCVISPKLYPHILFSTCSPNIENRPITVSANGDIRFCNHSPFVLGNVLKTPIKTIFESVQIKEFVRPSMCINCDEYEKCQGGCRAASEQVGSSLAEVDPIVRFLQ